MTDKEETMDSSDGDASAPSVKKNGRTSLLDSGEDFEVLDEEDIDDDPPPPLEDAGGGKGRTTDESEKKNADSDSDPPEPVEEWLDVLGMSQKKLHGNVSDCSRMYIPVEGVLVGYEFILMSGAQGVVISL